MNIIGLLCSLSFMALLPQQSVNGIKYTLNDGSRILFKSDADTDDTVMDGNILPITPSGVTNYSINKAATLTTTFNTNGYEINNFVNL